MRLKQQLARLAAPPRRAEATAEPSVHTESCAVTPLMHQAQNANAHDVAAVARDATLAAVPMHNMLLLDLETTGLAGGTGTLPFVIGIGWFAQTQFTVRQWLLPRPGAEGPILRELQLRLEQASCLVTFNGKSFDWPLLKTRFILNRLPLQSLPHVDVLHCARRIYKNQFESLRLEVLQHQLLGHRRLNDIPGALIPELYFRALRENRPELLQPVLEHNAQDIVALAGVFGAVLKRYADDPEVRAEALLFSAKELRRARAFNAAADVLHQGLASLHRSTPIAAQLNLHLCRLYEHRLKDPQRALSHAQHTAAAEGPEAQGRRLHRLKRKLS